MAPSPSFAANQYWVGGASGYWSGENWASAAGGTGAAWTDSNRAYFTTSPSTIDLNGASPTASDFYTTGFSEANRCAINITNTSETPSTITFKSLNRNADDELGWADLSFSNVAVVDTSDWGFEIFSGTHITFGNGSTYTKPNANSSGDMYVGFNLARSNTVEIASGATVSLNKNLWIGCSKESTSVACTGVVHVAGGTLTVPGALQMGKSTSDGGISSAGHGVLVVENGGVVNVTGQTTLCNGYSSKTKDYSGKQTVEIHVNEGGTLNLAKVVASEYGTKSIVIDGGLLKTTGNFEPEYKKESNGLIRYKSRNFTLEVKNGGILEVGGAFYVNSHSSYRQTARFDGGTFRTGVSTSTLSSSAGNGDYTDLLVGAGGMTIDTQDYTLTWQTRIDESEGKVTKKGSGKLNLNWTTYNSGGMDVAEGTLSFGGTNTRIWNGPLTVEGGATLEKQTGNNPEYLAPSVVFKDGAKLNIPYSNGAVGAVSANAITLEDALEVSFSATPAPGAYPLLTILGEGTFDASALEGITLPDDPAFAGAVLSLSADAKSVVLILSSDPVWIGGTSGDLGDPSNWSNGVVPQAGTNAVITAAAAAFLTNSAAFTAKSITFSAGCPKVTIEGTPLEDMVAINNLSSANHEFKTAVVADALSISNTTTYCVFTGGLTVNSVSFAETGNDKCSIYGVWHIKDDWTPVSGNALYNGASVTVDGALLNPNNLSINSGCVVTAATLRATGSCQHLTYYNAGRLVVKELCEIATTGDSYLTRNGQGATATVEFGGYRDSASDGWQRINAKNVIVGADGIENNRNVHFRESAILHPRTSGFEFKGSGKYYTTDDGVTIDTTQYETELPATIEINSVFAYFASGNIGKMAVIGCGKVVFKSVSTFTGGLTVSDTATVAVNPGMRPGNGTVTVRNGATLQVAQSGTVALGGGLTLDDGAALGFNFTERRTAPALDVTGKAVTLNGDKNVLVKISAEEGMRPKGGSHVLTSGGKFVGANVSPAAGAPDWAGPVSVVDGEIVLYVKPCGTMILVK